MLYHFKMADKYPIFVLRHFNFGQNLKKKSIFLKELFNEIWLEVGEHEQIYITEKPFLNFFFASKWRENVFFFWILCNNT